MYEVYEIMVKYITEQKKKKNPNRIHIIYEITLHISIAIWLKNHLNEIDFYTSLMQMYTYCASQNILDCIQVTNQVLGALIKPTCEHIIV